MTNSPRRAPRRRRSVVPIATAAVLGLAAAFAAPQAPAAGPVLTGTVFSGPTGVAGPQVVLAGARVTVHAAGPRGSVPVGRAVTDDAGEFSARHRAARPGEVLYAVSVGGAPAEPGSGSPVRPTGGARAHLALMTVLNTRDGSRRTVAINELTTVAGAYALARFARGARVTGPRPGLPIAAATAASLADGRTGKPSFTIASPPNGSATEALATLNTLANMLSTCARGTRASCAPLLRAANQRPGAGSPTTLHAMQSIARHPSHGAARLFGLGRSGTFSPSLAGAPRAWTLALVHTGGGMNGPGLMAFDHAGRIWVNSNFQRPGTAPGRVLTRLDPTGAPLADNPLTGGGLAGSGWGIAVGRRGEVWLANFAGGSVSQFDSRGRALSPPRGFRQGNPVRPQGLALAPDGTVWVADFGGDKVIIYPEGDPNRAMVRSQGIQRPFGVALDADGASWVTNNVDPRPGSGGGWVTRIDPDGTVGTSIRGGGLASPQGIAIDADGNKWVANFFSNSVTRIGPDGTVSPGSPHRAPSLRGTWGIAVDGVGNVWVSGFRGRTLTQLCGARPGACPPGVATGEVISPLRGGFSSRGQQHTTGVQIDQAGNVWMANNWSTGTPITNPVGGNGLVQYIGLAEPVATPMIGPVRRP